MSIVFIRLDKIGDLVATLPIDQALPKSLSQNLHWVLPKGLGLLAGDHRSYLELDLKTEKESEKKLVQYLKQVDAKMVVIFFAPWWVSRACWKAGVALRVGRRSQWHSYIFLNHGLRQSRTLAEKHEADYNFELMQFALEKYESGKYSKLLFTDKNSSENFPSTNINSEKINSQKLDSENIEQDLVNSKKSSAIELAASKKTQNNSSSVIFSSQQTPILKLEAKTLRHLFEKFAIQPKKYFVVHPGMAGSALNWPSERYSELIEKLITHGPVLITGTSADEKYLAPLRAKWQKHPQIRWLQGQLNLGELLSVLSNAQTVIAPSTGVLHLAASCGTHCVGIYSPILVHRALRWGPRGDQATSITPDANCPAQKKCLGDKCPSHPCMPLIDAEQVFQLALQAGDL